MAKIEQQKASRQQVYKPLLATALAVAGVFNMMSFAIAEEPDAGQTISNTATATYQDNGGDTINATSNTVTVTVAEVAGLTAVPIGITDRDEDAVEAGDILDYFFEVENTGNAATNIFIPGPDNVLRQNLDIDTVDIVTIDNNGTPDNPNDDTVTSVQSIPDGGALTATAVGPNESIIVRVTGTPSSTASAGDSLGVTLGDVTPADNNASPGDNDNSSENTQNQPYVADTGGNNDDLYTQDLDNSNANDNGLSPANGPREASATQDITFASSVNPLAFATVLKNSSQDVGDPEVTTDNLITYDLSVRVENNDPTSVYQPAALAGTPLVIDSDPATNYILVSDAIPAGTVFGSISSVPTDWEVVYSTVAAAGSDPLSLNDGTNNTLADAEWSRTQPANPADITRIGFITPNSISPGSQIDGLAFTVVTSGLDDTTGGTVNNIAQVFGSTSGRDPGKVIYDESGDTTPNNNTTPDPTTGTNYPEAGDDGVADPNTDADGGDGVDPGNNNTGDNDDDDGEVNQIVVGPEAAFDILNGPLNQPGARGPNNIDDDFTNDSMPIGPGLQEGSSDFTPPVVTYENTVSNPTTGRIADVAIEPISATEAALASPGGYFGVDDPDTAAQDAAVASTIPTGTVVTIRYAGGNDGTIAQTATYIYDGSDFVTDDDPVNVGDLAPNATVNYEVDVTLPSGSDITLPDGSTLTTDATEVLDEVPIPIVAFPEDSEADSPGFTNERTNNVTINRVYAGFMQLVKKARVLKEDGSYSPSATFVEDVSTADLRSGDTIEYRIEYLNISTANGGTNSVTLSANSFTIVEDGTVDVIPGWFLVSLPLLLSLTTGQALQPIRRVQTLVMAVLYIAQSQAVLLFHPNLLAARMSRFMKMRLAL